MPGYVTLTKGSKGKAKEQEARDLMRSHTGKPGKLAGNKIFDERCGQSAHCRSRDSVQQCRVTQ